MRLEISPETTLVSPTKIEKVCEHEPEYYLWAVKWNTSGRIHGISFHCRHEDAKKFCRKMDRRIVEPAYERASKMKLVKVSKWLYDQVASVGDYWTGLHSFKDAEFFVGPTYH